MLDCDWSSDVCSSDLAEQLVGMGYQGPEEVPSWLTESLLRRFEKRKVPAATGGMSGRGTVQPGAPSGADDRIPESSTDALMAAAGRPVTPKGTGPAPKFSRYNHKADGPDEHEFMAWYSERASRLGLDPNPDAKEHFYDYRAAFMAGAEPDASGHWPSEFKREGHPRMIVDGVNTKTGERVGADKVATTWKRLSPKEQADLRKTLLDAVASAARYDFHGALAPILRKAGVDLGSVPKGLAKELREALKKKRAEGKAKGGK
jgi:hypothetical protein